MSVIAKRLWIARDDNARNQNFHMESGRWQPNAEGIIKILVHMFFAEIQSIESRVRVFKRQEKT